MELMSIRIEELEWELEKLKLMQKTREHANKSLS